jgi:hypothetical protein
MEKRIVCLAVVDHVRGSERFAEAAHRAVEDSPVVLQIKTFNTFTRAEVHVFAAKAAGRLICLTDKSEIVDIKRIAERSRGRVVVLSSAVLKPSQISSLAPLNVPWKSGDPFYFWKEGVLSSPETLARILA